MPSLLDHIYANDGNHIHSGLFAFDVTSKHLSTLVTMQQNPHIK